MNQEELNLINKMGDLILFIPERVKLTNLKKIPSTSCWRRSRHIRSESLELHVNVRTGQRLVISDSLIFDIGVCY